MAEPMKIEAPENPSKPALDVENLNGTNPADHIDVQAFSEYLSPSFTRRLERHMSDAIKQAIQQRDD